MKRMRELNGFWGGLMQGFLPEASGQDGQVGETKPQSLDDLLATSGTGWAAIINGIMDVRTISDGKNTAALNAIHVCGFHPRTTCVDPDCDPDCDCIVKVLADCMPDVKLVRVRVEACSHD